MTPWRTGTMHPDQSTPDGYTGTLYLGGRILQIRNWRKTGNVIEFEARDIGADDWVERNFGEGA